MINITIIYYSFYKVKLGIYLPNNEKVVTKILEKHRIMEKDDEIRIKREFDMLAQFNHPNVILVAEIFESEDCFYNVMEFCEGGEFPLILIINVLINFYIINFKNLFVLYFLKQKTLLYILRVILFN